MITGVATGHSSYVIHRCNVWIAMPIGGVFMCRIYKLWSRRVPLPTMYMSIYLCNLALGTRRALLTLFITSMLLAGLLDHPSPHPAEL